MKWPKRTDVYIDQNAPYIEQNHFNPRQLNEVYPSSDKWGSKVYFIFGTTQEARQARRGKPPKCGNPHGESVRDLKTEALVIQHEKLWGNAILPADPGIQSWLSQELDPRS